MDCISDRFSVLEPSNLIKTSETELSKFVQSLFSIYYELSADDILTEIPRLRRFLKAAKVPKQESLGWPSLRFLRVCSGTPGWAGDVTFPHVNGRKSDVSSKLELLNSG
ncbi:hypothetical protein AVEN_244583-1 [Araneus ventricosus]|uniref:Uncharacterized protein n=1 Tax=Araneus ventricosus TaxID=182803 RepID=A0A4Y2PQL4_ARAVE|nr:hypothetical protein AVEN_244583-1 [Araneus ventricosus]